MSADFRTDGAAALEWAANYLERVGELPVLPRLAPGDLRRALPSSPPDEGEPFANVLRDLDELILPAVTHWQSPRFFGYFAVTGSEPAILAELLAATLNQVAFIWRVSPASTELELHVLDWLAQLLGLPEGWHGHIEDSASTSTLAALIAARHVTGGNRVLCSEHAHSSVEKGARMLGLEVVKIPADGEFRMRLDELARELERGGTAAVVATVGTTSSTAVDPVPEIAELFDEAGAWLHVDAAYAGSSWVCPELRWSQNGVELADSLVVNPHKWLFVPMDCSALWTSRPEDFRAAFTLVPEYLRTSDEAESLSDYGPALGRRFRSLKLWAVLRCYGRPGCRSASARRFGWPSSSRVGSAPSRAGSSAPHGASASFASGGRGRTRRTKCCSSGSTRRARSSSPTRSWRDATCFGWPWATSARPRPTSREPGKSCGRRPAEGGESGG